MLIASEKGMRDCQHSLSTVPFMGPLRTLLETVPSFVKLNVIHTITDFFMLLTYIFMTYRGAPSYTERETYINVCMRQLYVDRVNHQECDMNNSWFTLYTGGAIIITDWPWVICCPYSKL